MYEMMKSASSSDGAGYLEGSGSSQPAAQSVSTARTEAPPTGDPAGHMVQLVTGIARLLVDLPDQVNLEAVSSADGTVLRLRVANGDIGKIIGKQGRTARSLRTIISAASMKLKHRFSLDIVEEKTALESA